MVWYCIHATSQSHKVIRVVVHGDDIMLATSHPMDVKLIIKAMSGLGMTLNLDEKGSSVPGSNKVSFLGSI